MHKNGDGVPENEDLYQKFMMMAQDIHEQTSKERERIKFQEGVETSGKVPVKS